MTTDKFRNVITTRIGILGGSFNPVHKDHLAIAEDAKKLLGLNKVLFIPNASPAYKSSVNVSYKDRRHMLEIALKNHGDHAFEICDLEDDDSQHHYTFDTLKMLRRIYGDDVPMFFIMGSDSLLYIDEWKEGLHLHELANLLCFMRAGYENADIKPSIQKLIDDHGIRDSDEHFNECLSQSAGKILLVSKPHSLVSSSVLRKALARDGLNNALVLNHVDPEVTRYALNKGLYGEPVD